MPTPRQLGYRMPAEWEPHAATWLSWPHRRATWPGKFDPIPGVWANLVRTLAEFEPVHIAAGGADVMEEARRLVVSVANVTLHEIETNDAWARDHGPIFLVGPLGAPPALVDWLFNAWGGKYPCELDDRVPAQVAAITGRTRFEPGIVLEGGAIEPNGRGTLLTTEQCLLHPNRNPRLSRQEIERYLLDYLAASHVIWLKEGIVGDDTDGHIDEVARFVNPTTVVAATVDDPQDVNFGRLAECWQRLKAARDQDGRELTIVPLPMPEPMFHNQQRLPASYCNFYIANGVVIVPQFENPRDAHALETFARLFPDRQVRGLPARGLVWGLGAYHCITQQQPRG